ncbi:S1C family serine protease [Anaeromicropila populeti]|uniref:Serine protease Do n=1 Tax=Anaeromicropila populeti TaxID=37658 RepID=A0A1I6KS66_9FIRM|nr:trypsin-like peptidase domain-containing protein [Anaeromicropila populeti]SFR94072.1 serine protease Do [Anaeromicropila populeti]
MYNPDDFSNGSGNQDGVNGGDGFEYKVNDVNVVNGKTPEEMAEINHVIHREMETGYGDSYGGKTESLNNNYGTNNYGNNQHYQNSNNGTTAMLDQGLSNLGNRGAVQNAPMQNGAYYGNAVPVPPKKKKAGGGKTFLMVAAIVITICFFGGAGIFGVHLISEKLNGSQHSGNNTQESLDVADDSDENTINSTESASITEDSVSQVVKNVMPAIVSINTTSLEAYDFFGTEYTQPVTGSGSGIIIGQNETEVLIATNNHVVAGENPEVKVTFCDDETVTATIKGTDTTSDLAVIAVLFKDLKDSTKESILVATTGDSDSLQVGEKVIAIGNALGYGQSVTVGYVSAKDREVSMEDASMTLLQTDAAINPGNSGGALLNAKGEVIGINSVKYALTEVEGMCFAIPISTAIPIINDLMTRDQLDESQQAYLGIIGKDVSEEDSQRIDIPIGIYVNEVTNGSPADMAGLEAGNVIIGMDGKTIATNEDLKNILSYTRAGTTVDLVVKERRNGKWVEKTLSVTLGSKADANN